MARRIARRAVTNTALHQHRSNLSFLFADIGGGNVTANWYPFLTSLFPFAFLVARIRIGEEKLVQRFDDYRSYTPRTGRFWPRLGRQ